MYRRRAAGTAGRAAVLVWLVVVVSPAAAQVIEGPPRPSHGRFSERQRQVDPNRSAQALLITLNAAGGYDRNLEPEDPLVPIDRFTVPSRGYAFAGSARVDYRRGTATKYLRTYGFVYQAKAETSAGQPLGGDATAEFAVPMGRRAGFNAGAGAAYTPTYLFNAYSALTPQIPEGTTLDVGRTQGITEQRWLASRAFANVFRNWTSRNRTDVSYDDNLRTTTGNTPTGSGTDTRLQFASVRHVWTPNEPVQVQMSYRFGRYRQEQVVAGIPLDSHAIDGGLRFEHRMSPTRSAFFSVGGGVTQARNTTLASDETTESWLPTVYGGFQTNLSRTWTVGADIRRDVTVLDSLAPQPYATNAVTARVGGMMGARTTAAVNWSSAYGSTSEGSFDTSTGVAQIQFMLSQSAAIFGGYSYYQHRFENVLFQQNGLPRRYSQNSVRVGVTVWLEPVS
jgi:hypothetical protein